MKDPNFEEENEIPSVDHEMRDMLENLDGYREYQKEIRGDSLTFGDF